MKQIFFLPDRCLPGCNACQMACVGEHLKNRGLLSPLSGLPFPRKRQSSLYTHDIKHFFPHPLRCLHCESPRCVEACLSGSLKKSAGDGRISNNLEQCIGCYMCVAQCPYGAVIPSAAERVSVKCDGCLWSKAPACVRACPSGALVYCEESVFERKSDAEEPYKKRHFSEHPLTMARF